MEEVLLATLAGVSGAAPPEALTRRIVHRGRTLGVSEATLKDAGGKLLAFGTETCSIFPVANLAAR